MATEALDAAAFTAAFARHGRTLWVLAAAWVGRADAADLVQETARVAWQRRAQFAAGTDLRAWLSQIARHVGANWRRRRRPELPGEVDPPAPAPGLAPVLPFDADRVGLSDELARGLAALPEPQREALLLHAVLGLPFAEIGALLGVPENTATSHARRAREALRERLAAADPTRSAEVKTR